MDLGGFGSFFADNSSVEDQLRRRKKKKTMGLLIETQQHEGALSM